MSAVRPSVAVIDYGMGNLHSVASALQAVGGDIEVRVSSDPETILSADRVILPGFGAIRDCMAELQRRGLDTVARAAADSGKPLLGICVGMQALMQHSEENGGVDCLGTLPGQVKFFGDPLRDADGNRLKVPHMGWNRVHQARLHPLWAGINQDSRFYFVHSYYVHSADPALVAATTDYGVTLHAALARGNLFAVQFHPEKSSDAGLALLRNFLAWDGRA